MGTSRQRFQNYMKRKGETDKCREFELPES